MNVKNIIYAIHRMCGEGRIMKKLLNLSLRRKEVLLTVSANFVLQIVTALCGFVLQPLVIKIFGSSVNGMVSSITQFIAYLNIVEAGVGGASTAALYKPLAHGDTTERNAILSATARFYNCSGVLFTILVCILAFVYPLLVGSEVDRLQSGLMVMVLGITGAAEFFLIGKYRVLLTADKKIYMISLVQMGALIVSTALAVVLIKTDCGIVGVKLASALMFLARYLVLALYVRLHYPKVNFHAEPDTHAISQSKNLLVHQIGGLVVFNSPLVIITIFCSLKDASVYTVYAMVFNAVNQLLGAFSNGMQSFFGESLVTDSIERTRSIFARYETVYFAIGGWFYTMSYLLIMPFMRLYTVNMTDADYLQPILAVLFVFVGFLNNLRNPAVQLINAVGHFKQTQWRSVVETVINVVCSIAGVMILGFKGVLLGAVCSGLYREIDVLVYTSCHILKSARAGISAFIKILFCIFYFFVLCFLIKRHSSFQPVSYVQWMGVAVLYGMLLALPLLVIFVCSRAGKNK